MSVTVALPAAFAYGIADFAGGLAARREAALRVTAIVGLIGLLTLLPATLLVPGRPSVAAAGLGALAGIGGAGGLLLYLRGLAVGPMGVVAPLSAVVGAGLPLLAGLLSGERPGPVTLLALGIALAAIVLATAGTTAGSADRTGLLLGLAAGVGFGLFFVALDATPGDSGLWPLLAGRLTATTLLGALVLARRPSAPRPGPRPWLLIAISGVFDTAANVLFLVATRLGDLGVSAVVVSLYPVLVVLLARLVLREHLNAAQLTSAALAVGASVLLAAGG